MMSRTGYRRARGRRIAEREREPRGSRRLAGAGPGESYRDLLAQVAQCSFPIAMRRADDAKKLRREYLTRHGDAGEESECFHEVADAVGALIGVLGLQAGDGALWNVLYLNGERSDAAELVRAPGHLRGAASMTLAAWSDGRGEAARARTGDRARRIRRRDGHLDDGVARAARARALQNHPRRRGVRPTPASAFTRACSRRAGANSRRVDRHRDVLAIWRGVGRGLLTAMCRQDKVDLEPLVAVRDGQTALRLDGHARSDKAGRSNQRARLAKSLTGQPYSANTAVRWMPVATSTRGPGAASMAAQVERADAGARRCTRSSIRTRGSLGDFEMLPVCRCERPEPACRHGRT